MYEKQKIQFTTGVQSRERERERNSNLQNEMILPNNSIINDFHQPDETNYFVNVLLLLPPALPSPSFPPVRKTDYYYYYNVNESIFLKVFFFFFSIFVTGFKREKNF